MIRDITYTDKFVLSGSWLSPRSWYYAPEAATSQRVWTGCLSGEAAFSCWVRVPSQPSPVAVSSPDIGWVNCKLLCCGAECASKTWPVKTLEYCHTQSNSADLHRVWLARNRHSHLPVSRVRVRPVLLGYAHPVLPIQHGTPLISGKKCQVQYIYMVYTVSHMYMLFIFVVHTCTDLIVLTAGLFGNYPSSSILHWGAWRRLWRSRIVIWSGQHVICASPAVLPLYTVPHRYCGGPLQQFRRNIPLDLVFFSPFEELCLRTAGIMESKRIHRVYEPSPVHTLYVGRVDELLGRVPLIPYFLDGNSTSTIPHKYSSLQRDAFECCCTNGAGPTSQRVSHVYEINTWLWNFGVFWTAPASRGRPLWGQDWEDLKEVPIWCCQTSVGHKAGSDCQGTRKYMVSWYTWYMHDIYLVYPCCESNLSFMYIWVGVLCYHAACMYFQFFQLP